MARTRLAAVPLAVAAGAHLLPSVLTVPPLRTRVVPPARADATHVALTFDDGPHPASTPAFVDLLARIGVRATFFVLGSQLAEHPDLGTRIVGGGHEIAVHGWSHRPHLLRQPAAILSELRRAVEAVRTMTGVLPTFWRPPHGILTGAGLWAAHRLGLRTALWTADGRDWRADATRTGITARIESQLRPGGVVLLHDSDVASAPGSWRAALAAVPDVVAACARRGWAVGTLAAHSPRAGQDGEHADC
jgi:peptidoglycan/xylan/chitin deacetylase (PgdA/CDA1 family)